MHTHQFLPLQLVVMVVALAAAAPCQCNPQWLPGPPIAGTDQSVDAIVEWDPDGSGPATTVLVFAGGFMAAGNVAASRAATYDPATGTWSPLNSTALYITDLAVLQNGDLIAAANYHSPLSARVERWNGTSWVPLGSTFNGRLNALAVHPNGDVFAGGTFTLASGTSAECVARWDGSSWSALGAGVSSEVHDLMIHQGDLIACGWFSLAGGTVVNSIARWNGTSWAALGTGTNHAVFALATAPNGDIIASGDFHTIGGVSASRVARWNGVAWSSLGAGVADGGRLATLANGDVLLGSGELMHWNGTTWSQFGDVSGTVLQILPLANGSIMVVGVFTSADAVVTANVAMWTGGTWTQLGPPGVPTKIPVVATAMNGDAIVASKTATSGPSRVSRYTGTSWVPLGAEFLGGDIEALLRTANEDVVAAGSFSTVGGVAANRIARWNGISWSPLGSGLGNASSNVYALAELPNGDIVAAGNFLTAGGAPAANIARWNGVAWAPLGPGLGSSVASLAIAGNGDIVAGGGLGLLGTSRVARWNGTAWLGLGTMTGAVDVVLALPGGDIVAGSRYWMAGVGNMNHVARWNGTNWTRVGNNFSAATGTAAVWGLALLPDGDIVACGHFDAVGGVPAAGVARWNGVTWSALATSTIGTLTQVVAAPDGSIVGTGAVALNGVVSAGFARLWTTCPASAAVSATGCTGSAGANVLAATSLPWTGATYRGLATGLPSNALALDVYGLTTLAVPLATLLPQGVAGCSLLVTPDFVTALLPAGGTVGTQLAIPDTMALAGSVVHQQVVTFELASSGAIVALTGSNRLTLTFGTL